MVFGLPFRTGGPLWRKQMAEGGRVTVEPPKPDSDPLPRIELKSSPGRKLRRGVGSYSPPRVRKPALGLTPGQVRWRLAKKRRERLRKLGQGEMSEGG